MADIGKPSYSSPAEIWEHRASEYQTTVVLLYTLNGGKWRGGLRCLDQSKSKLKAQSKFWDQIWFF